MINLGFVRLYWRDRLFEWVTAGMMIGFAITIALWPDTIQASSFRYILRVISAESMGVFFTVFGVMRFSALIANGSWPIYGPRFRTIGAGAGALMWGQLSASLIYLSPPHPPSPGIPVYILLTVGELISAYRVMSDARYSV